MCLGAIANSLTKSEFNQIMFGQKGIITYLKENDATDRVAIERRKFTLQALSGILKNHAAEHELAEVIGKFLREEASKLKKLGEDGNSEKSDEMLECVIQSFQSLIKTLKSNDLNLILKDQDHFVKSVIELAQYSPHSEIVYHTDIQDEDDEYADDTADESSWRVRRAALQLVGAVSMASSALSSQFATHTEIYTSLTEKNECVVEAVFGMVSDLASSLSHSADTNAIHSLLENVFKQLKELSKHVNNM